jgi:hypothetical protein
MDRHVGSGAGAAVIDPRPWFRLEPDAVLHDERVEMLGSFEQLGMLFYLACHEWKFGPLLDSDEYVERLCSHLVTDFKTSWPRVKACFDRTDDGRLAVPWLEAERQRADGLRAKRSACGSLAHTQSTGNSPANADVCSANARHKQGNAPDLQGDVDGDVDGRKRSASASPPPAASKSVTGSAHQEFITFWCDAFLRSKGIAYGFADGKDGKLVKEILKKAGGDLELAKALATALLTSRDPFYTEKGVDLGVLCSQWNRLASAQPKHAHGRGEPNGPPYHRFSPPDPEAPL